MRVRLPANLGLTCPSCALEFQLETRRAAQLGDLRCPGCGESEELYYWLEPQIRHELSAVIRSRIYFAAHRLNSDHEAG